MIKNDIDTQYLNIKNETIGHMKDLLKDVKTYKHIQLENKIKELEKELKEVKKAKKYWLVWEEKQEIFDSETIWKLPILKELKEKSIKQNYNQNNILIEWDNYHTLSVLNYTNAWKIDIIYIDPPYNTWNNDFIYNDKIVDREDKFRHSKWLSFMNKRLKLAKDLLSDNWVIFISIDDNEFAQLKLLCDEIFWSENFIANLVWLNKEWWGWSDSKQFKIKHEYILTYWRNKENIIIPWIDQIEDKSYNNEDDFVKERWKYKLIKLNSFSLWYIESLDFWIKWPDWVEYFPNKWNEKIARWRWSKKKVYWWIENNFIVFKDWNVYTKQYFKVDNENKQIIRTEIPTWVIEQFSSTMATKQIDNIFWNKAFSYSKPFLLIKYLIQILWINYKNSIILDFFAWSWTTWHAVLELNKEDWWNRKFILSTNNENNICKEVTYERIKRIMTWYTNQKWEKVEWLGWNLTYLKTDFIDKSNVNDDLRVRMVAKCSELLCLKENIWNEIKQKNDKIKIFERHDKYLAILYDMFFFDDFKEVIKKFDKPVSIYAFSHYKLSKNDFYDINIDFEIEQIPDPILEIYESIFWL